MDLKKQQNVIDNFINLTNSLQILYEQIIIDKQYPIWLHNTNTLNNLELRHYAISKISQLKYEDSQDKRKVIICPGFIACSSNTLDAINTVNLAKNKFKEYLVELKKDNFHISKIQQHLVIESSSKIRHHQTAKLLKHTSLARLHLKQCYRNIVALPLKPKKISWTWAHTTAIKKLSITQAQVLLEEKTQDLGIILQQKKLASLSPNESLAIVQELAPNLRANIVYNNGAKNRQMLKGHLPIFYLDENQTKTPPEFVIPKKKSSPDSKRTKRSDQKLSPEVFLPAIRAHRYLKKPVI